MLKLSLKHRRNMSIHLYSTKSLRNNFITLLFLYKPLNYKSSSMRNNYILKITLSPSLRNRRSKKKTERTTRNYRTLKQRQVVAVEKKIERTTRNYRTLKRQIL